MNFDPNDPRWSALILDPDSLSADERRELNELAANNEAAGRLLGELRAAAGEMEVELRKELVTPSQWRDMEAAVKNELANKVEKPVKIAAEGQAWRFSWVQGLVALAIVAVTGVLLLPRMQSARQAVRRSIAVQRPAATKAAPEITPMYDDVNELRLREREEKVRELGDLVATGSATSEGLDVSGATTAPRSPIASVATHGGRPANPQPAGPARADDYVAPTFEYSERSVDKLQDRPTPAGQPSAPPAPPRIKRIETYSSGGKEVVQFSDEQIREAETNSRYVKPHVIVESAPASAPAAESKPRLHQYNSPEPKDNRGLATDGEPKLAFATIPQEEARESTRLHSGVNRWHAETPYGNTEVYPTLVENAFIKAAGQDALSTFSIDVDTASYANVRRFLTQNMLPPAGAVRVEELVNYFRYDYAPPTGEHPFAVHVETAACPWEPKHRLARIALKGKVIDEDKRPASNLVFLLDVSGSMNEPNKLPLVKQSLRMLVERLTENDRVAIAVYAGASGLALDSTTGDKKDLILGAIDSLTPGGSTNGEAGIRLAYQQAVKGFIKGGTNRVILCTDGDFNVGVSDDTELVNIITEQAKSGVFLSVLGFGMGNYKDAKMMQLSDKGNGNYAYIDTAREGRKVLVEQMSGTLITIAKDVKIQIEFNPQKVAAYRLIGYEKRMLKNEDFKDDTKDAGEIGAGHTVTALYELVPVDGAVPSKVDPLIFQPTKPAAEAKPVEGPADDRTLVVKLRYKKPDGDTSTEFRTDCKDEGKAFSAATKDFQFASAVASFGMIMRNSEFKGGGNLAAVAEIASAAKGADEGGYRQEFTDLVNAARRIAPGK